MARIYEQYVTGADRELMIQEAEDRIFDDKIAFMLETVERERELNKKEAELLVLKENGTYDDLMYLYQEADKEAEQKKGGILEAIGNAIRSIFSSIGRFLSNLGKKSNENPNEEKEVDEDAWHAAEVVKKTWDSNIGKGILVAAGATVAALTGLSLFANSADKEGKEPGKVKVTLRALNDKINFLNPIVQKFTGNISELFKKKDGEEKSGEEADAGKVKGLGGMIQKILGKLGNPFGLGLKNNEEGTEEKPAEEEKKGGLHELRQKQKDRAAARKAEADKKLAKDRADYNDGHSYLDQQYEERVRMQKLFEDISATTFIESLFGGPELDDEMFEEDVEDNDILDMFDAIFE